MSKKLVPGRWYFNSARTYAECQASGLFFEAFLGNGTWWNVFVYLDTKDLTEAVQVKTNGWRSLPRAAGLAVRELERRTTLALAAATPMEVEASTVGELDD